MMRFREWLLESMNIYVKDYDYNNQVNDLDDLSNHLYRKVVVPMWNKLDAEQKKVVANHEIISPDGSYYSGKSNIINFYSFGWPLEMVKNIDQGIKFYLDELGVRYGEFKVEKSGMFNGDVIRIPILQIKKNGGPPVLNMSNDNARLIFTDLLGFTNLEEEISVDELLFRIANLDKDKLQIHAREPYQSQQKDKATVYHGGLSPHDIEVRLEQIKNISQWAKQNHYDTIYVA